MTKGLRGGVLPGVLPLDYEGLRGRARLANPCWYALQSLWLAGAEQGVSVRAFFLLLAAERLLIWH